MGTPPINLNSFFEGLQDTPSSYTNQAGRIPFVNSSETGLQYINYNKAPMNNGLITGGAITVNATNPLTQIDVAAGTGRIVNPINDVTQEAFTNVDWLASTITINQPDFFGAVAIGVDDTGTVNQYSDYTPAIRKNNIMLGLIYYADSEITRVFNVPHVLSQQQEMFEDYVEWLAAKDRVQGLAVRGVTSNLQVWRDSGTSFIPYANWTTDPQNPHLVVYPQAGNATTPILLQKVQSNDTIGADDTTVPIQWDNGGTLTTLTGTEATIHYLFMPIDGSEHLLQYGLKKYTDFAEAISNLSEDADSTTFFTNANRLILLAQVIVSATSTEFDGTTATIRNGVDAGGAGGVGAVTTFLSLTDTPSDYTGSAGKSAIVNATEDGLTFEDVGMKEYTTGEDYGVGNVFYYNNGIYKVTTAITNAPATPPWASLENINHQARSSTGGAITPVQDYDLTSKKYTDDTFVEKAGDTMTGDLIIANPNDINFGSTTRQMVNLYSTTFGIGVESSTTYARTSANFRVYKGGTHSGSAANGTLLFSVDTDGRVYSGQSSTTFPTITANNQLTTKKYVDDKTSGSAGGFANVTSLSITAGQLYTISTLGQNQGNNWQVGFRYSSGVNGVQVVNVSTSFRTQGTAEARFVLMGNSVNGTKIADQIRIHFDAGTYRLSFRAAVTTNINVGAFGINNTSGRYQTAVGLGTAVNAGTTYGSVAL